MSIPIEQIPDEDYLFRALHRMWFKQGQLVSGKAFKFDSDGCSVDWANYATPEETQSFNTTQSPENYGVGSMIAKEIRANDMKVQHNPQLERPAHSLIVPPSVNPEDIKECQFRLLKICKLILFPTELS